MYKSLHNVTSMCWTVFLFFFFVFLAHFSGKAESTTSLQGGYLRTENELIDSSKVYKTDIPIRSDLLLILQRAGSEAFRGGMMGAIAGAFQVLILMWLRTALNYQYRYGVSFQTALNELYRQGGVLRFYNGVSYALLQCPLSKFGSMAANEGSRVIVDHFLPNNAFSDSLSSALGAILSMIWKIILMPIETCKTVLQIDGRNAFKTLLLRFKAGNLSLLYEGSFSVALMTAVGHYPWFLTHNILDRFINKPTGFLSNVLRSSVIGFMASAVSDTVSNPIRIVKTVKQSMAVNSDISYSQVVAKVYREGGWRGLFLRGLTARLIGNGIQSIIFTNVWKILVFYDVFKTNSR